jgi:Ca2+-binding EF-hand superfamily protein
MFKLLDENRDGKVNFNEIKKVLEKLKSILKNDFDKEYEVL